MDKTLAIQITGGLSKPSKMPGYGFSISPKLCKKGAILRKVTGSVCAICYAFRGHYGFPAVQGAFEKRFIGLSHPLWVEAMAFLIGGNNLSNFFRWHDAGDIQSLEHLENIVRVCRATPKIRHWLPTREYGFVSDFLRLRGKFPSNLNVRLSAYMVDGPGPIRLAEKLGVTTSGVTKEGFNCPSSLQGNSCMECRACWDKKVKNINYKRH